jgi:hypothetical protein
VIKNDYIQAKDGQSQKAEEAKSLNQVLHSALSGEHKRRTDYDSPRVVQGTPSRNRFDTLEEMELLGQGKYGAGNVPLISSGLDSAPDEDEKPER